MAYTLALYFFALMQKSTKKDQAYPECLRPGRRACASLCVAVLLNVGWWDTLFAGWLDKFEVVAGSLLPGCGMAFF
ncbi:hypothetical protein [Phnomibacter ginsenosidimutans]|uniref:Uncharacterized protein n=1 Tax=Phnomibacter ginsenosidimutans TaxID=2676868 RepID=A0A6I6GA85_9BACT|nr:hypothetical protein [Phnomibacter ginsenosidimutans]QGW29736.1 hypothetical protein GLV81_17860 [Phnomibacter ginsenosidimutans]